MISKFSLLSGESKKELCDDFVEEVFLGSITLVI